MAEDAIEKEYIIKINPRILELLGPSLYTNIYYVLAELIANSYDAGAKNVYIIEKGDSIVVEDDGTGMSYQKGDIEKYLDVAVETRTNEEDSYVDGMNRKKMGRKGVGKLAALAVSEKVKIMTIREGDKSGFILSRHVGEDNKLDPINEEKINFEKIKDNGTSVVMTHPEYSLHKTAKSIKKNLLKMFPLVDNDFKIHIKTEKEEIVIEDFDKEMVQGLGALILLGYDFHHLAKHFNSGLENRELEKDLLEKEGVISIPMKLKNKEGQEKEYMLEIRGWVGAYRTTAGKKDDVNDFPDNFISIISNGKLGEYNILPTIGKNRLSEVYTVGQLHVNLLEETELPDISLSNRQGYKTDDKRYEFLLKCARELLEKIVDKRNLLARYKKDQEDEGKLEILKKEEEKLIKSIEKYKESASRKVTEKLKETFKDKMPEGVKEMIEGEMNESFPLMGIKKKIDAQKKRILISHSSQDKNLADIIYKMLSFNNVPDKDIIYTTSESVDCRIPNRMSIFQYLRTFFVDSYSDKKMYVIYVTSDEMSKSWNAVSEVGAGWITQSKQDIFNIKGFSPKPPLNVDPEWHTSERDGENITMEPKEFDKFVVKILDICKDLNYNPKNKQANFQELKRLVTIS